MSRRPHGVALISVLLVVAILLAVVGRLMANHGLTITQNQNVFEQNQALQYALAAETLARQALFEDFTTGGGEVDHLGEIWAQPVLPFELDEGGFLEAQVRDLNGCFNMNTVLDSEDGIARMKRLLANLEMPESLAEAWKDWIDSDLEVTGFGAEDSEYLVATVPHRTPNQLVSHVSEFAMLQNVDADMLQRILPYVCLLPDTESQVNVNTANLHTLSALDDAIAAQNVENVVGAPRAFASTSEFLDQYPEFRPASEVLSVSSQYFELHAFAQVGDSSVTLLSFLNRDPSTGEVTVLSRDFGRLFRSAVEMATEEAN